MSVEVYAKEIKKRLRGKDLRGVEIGVARGFLSVQLLQDDRIAMLYMIDSWAPPEQQSDEYRRTDSLYATMPAHKHTRNWIKAEQDTVFAIRRRFIIPLRSDDAVNCVPDGLDFVFIDGDHSYGGQLRDNDNWWPKLKPGGLFGGHDYDRPEFPGVKQAVDESARKYGWEIELGRDFTWFVKR